MSNSNKAVIILSGGLDSTVLLYKLLRDGREVSAIGFDYGQRHAKELRVAASQCMKLGVPFEVVHMDGFATLIPGSSQTDRSVSVPEGHYEEETMKQTVVPNRNMVMLSIAAAYALANGAEDVYYGAHGGDHVIYPDCRPEFVYALNEVLRLCDWKRVQVRAPFLAQQMDKGAIVRLGYSLNVPLHTTWTCYKGEEKHCGLCGSCQERREAFRTADVADLTEYENL